MRAPLLFAAVPLLAGSSVGVTFFTSPAPLPLCAAAGGVMALVAATALALQRDVESASAAVVLGSLLAGVSLGTSAAVRAYRPPILEWFETTRPVDPVVLEGVLREDAAPAAAGVSLVLDVRAVGGSTALERGLGGVRLSVGGALGLPRIHEWTAGRRVRAPVSLRLPSIYLNPGVRDDRRALARRGIVLVGTVKSGALVEVLGRGNAVEESAAAVRAWVRQHLSERLSPLDPKSAGITTAVLIGDRSGLSRDDERRLQEAGTYHVIAISGGNIAILAVIIFMAARMLLPRRIAAVVTALALVGYGFVAAGAASVTRAVTVAVVVLCGRALDHRGAALNALAVAATGSVAASPVLVLDAGFILSFGATLGILLGAPRIAGTLARHREKAARHGAVGGIRDAAVALGAATICAELALAPVGAGLFSRVPLAGLALNFLAIPLMTIVQSAGLTLLAAADWWDRAARTAAMAAHAAAAGLLRSAFLVEAAPWLVLDVAPPAYWVVAVWYLGLGGLLLRRSGRAAAVILAACAGLTIAGPRIAMRDAVAPSPFPVRVVVLDIGQGDATVVSLPGRALLVDSGGLPGISSSPEALEPAPGFDVGERVVAPAIRALGIRTLDSIVITHGDPDHLLGAPGLLRRVPARSIWEGVPVPPHPGLQQLAAIAAQRQMTWRTVQAGDAERFGGAEVRVLHPPPPDWERQRVRNDDSIVLEVRLGAVSIVLPGDIGAEGERTVLPRLEPGRLVILKVPHHGSATSSTPEFVRALQPAAVIVSSGRDNRFGHPHPAVIARYRAAGADIFSTAQDGAVFVETDGATVRVRGHQGRHVEYTTETR